MKRAGLVICAVCLLAPVLWAYPTDQFERTKIRRLPWQADVDAGKRRGTKTPPGAQWKSEQIKLRMTEAGKDFDLRADTPKDPVLQAGLEAILKRERWDDYYVSLLDITDPAHPRYAAVKETNSQTPGSVAKLLVAAAVLDQLKRRFPNDLAKREEILRNVMVVADDWAMPNHHEIPVVNGDSVQVRRVKVGDTFSLWEWLDHAISPSSNSAGTLAWREAILMKLMGEAYPPAQRDEALFKTWDKKTFTDAAFNVVDQPLVDAGLSTDDNYLRLFFTKGAGKYLSSDTSRASPLALLQWLVRVEQGRMVDAFSSLELKRLMYITRRRIRYIKSPSLNDSAVFFKSGSLFECKPEEGFQCIQYQGNVTNVLNAVVEVETPDPVAETSPAISPDSKNPDPEKKPNKNNQKRVYLVVVMSNELKRNAASDHAALGTAIHQLLLDN